MTHTKFVLLGYCLFLSSIGFSQHDLRRVSISTLPEQIKLIKDISVAIRWTDSIGDHVVLTTQKIKRPSDDVFFRRGERGLPEKSTSDLFEEPQLPATYSFTIKNDSAELNWKVVGTIKACAQGTEGDKLKGSFIVTDLNEDKIAEVWIIYKGICVDDETQANMRITLCQTNKRYTMSGTRSIKIEGETFKGFYQFDQAFKNAPTVFVAYAEKLWKRNELD
ncbi:MAG TPA: hypothetical protein VER36_06580 [Flavisolibacter sp.]|nr:hypothetical protein [Flavisolibacter sp.]